MTIAGRRYRVLVVEDDTQTRDVLAEVLSGDGYQVVLESTGLAGRARAIEEPFDLILLDIGLPDLDGFAVARLVRAAGIETPMVALSGWATDTDREQGLSAGFDDYLFKPIRASALRAEVAKQFGRPMEPPVVASSAVTAAAPSPAPPRRGVLGGLVVVAMGVPFILQSLGVPNAASYLFITMGAAFLISYLRGHQYVYLIPTVTLSSFGVALLLPTWLVMRPEAAAPAFIGVVALGFLTAFGVAPDRRWPLVPAVLLGAVAAARLTFGWSPLPGSLDPFLVPVVLVTVGAYLLIEPQS